MRAEGSALSLQREDARGSEQPSDAVGHGCGQDGERLTAF
jgi:metal-dependent amidase/aminoacylase/carboxypeptidase family protein